LALHPDRIANIFGPLTWIALLVLVLLSFSNWNECWDDGWVVNRCFVNGCSITVIQLKWNGLAEIKGAFNYGLNFVICVWTPTVHFTLILSAFLNCFLSKSVNVT